MIKTEYLGWKLDTIERVYKDDSWVVVYLGNKRASIVTGTGKKIESACAAAQKKIQVAERS